MFAPSFVTGAVIRWIGAPLVTAIGLLMIIGCAAAALSGITVAHFSLALILLGVGCNFGFIGSTAMLSTAYRPSEASRVQAINEQVVFGSSAVASLCSGVLLQTIGWESINMLAIPLATLAILLLGWSSMRSRSQRA